MSIEKLSRLKNRVKYGANLKKPRYMLRLGRNLVQRYFFGRRPLRGIDFAIDYACNLRCQHCFNKDITPGVRRMQFADYQRVYREAEQEGILNFCFQGGEFMALPTWPRYLEMLDAGKFSLSVTTNGTYLGPENIEKLVALGVNTLTVSLDSGLAKEHDTFRGVEGTFERAVEGVLRAKSAGLRVVINSTITPASMRSEGFLRLIEFAYREDFLLNTIFAAPSGNWIGCQEIVMKPDDIAYYNNLRREYNNVTRDIHSLYLGHGCPGVNESIYISPYGDVFGCAYIHIRLGNIFEESLKEIRAKGMPFFNYQKKCMAAENLDFIKEYNEIVDGKQLPLDFDAHHKIKSWK